MSESTLTVLSDGAGQDSWTILLKLALDPAFRQEYAPDDLVVVHADTGNEHPDTYLHVERIEAFCKLHGIEYHNLTADKGYHRGNWVSLQSFYEAKNAIGSKAYPKTCTDNLKIQPIYRWLTQWIQERYFPGRTNLLDRKKSLYEFVAKYGKIQVLIGIAADEAPKRIKVVPEGEESPEAVWMQKNILKIYPLIDLDYNRQACQTYIQSVGQTVPPPSNCVLCPFKSSIEILWTHMTYPESFQYWVVLEANKIAANLDKGEKNLGVFGRKLLPQVLAEAQIKYASMTYEEIDEYRMSHGHCVSSSY
jgi:3'-phosphoadenosine 5'-phosphosulfate sulfotransferase (PAPS reductase)/FAD synthetase